ncbi:MAG TPA: DNA-binding response regulator [Methylococcaceae bacterium]|nr:DNA-binding response regulator [Methylococcaceae bacterium]
MTIHKGIVMIVDDMPDNLALLSDTLSEAGYRVLVATDGLSAIEQIAYLKPDIILLDVMMPGIDGFATCQRLKLKSETRTIPILFMTALSELDHLLRGFDEGAVDYLVKPIRPPEVVARIEVQLTQMRTLQRTEALLNSREFAALAIDHQGQITWLTSSGALWLKDFTNTYALPYHVDVGQQLPTPLMEWVNACLSARPAPFTPFKNHHDNSQFSSKMIPCKQENEYILLLEKNSGEWALDTLKQSLGLTMRETEILMWISRGKTNKEIGIILGSSPRTINKHLEHIFEKLGVTTRTAAVSVALQCHINTA